MKNSKSQEPILHVYLKAFGFTFVFVYVLWSAKEIARLSNDVEILKTRGLLELQKVHHFYSIDKDESIEPYHRTRRATAKTSPCNKVKRYLKSCRKKLRRNKATSKKEDTMKAAHFSLDFHINSTMMNKLYYATNKCFNEFGGVVCYNNKTFESNTRVSENTLLGVPWKLYSPAGWSPLVNTTNNGEFKVKYDGLYFVYLNILFIPTQQDERAGVFLNDKQILTCQEGLTLDQVSEITERPQNFTEKSCSTFGIFIIGTNQVISIRIETQNTKIRLWDVGNSFGAILLQKR